MLDVVEVVAQLFHGVLARGAVAVLHLRPPGEARLDGVALLVERNLLRQLLDEERAFRTRPDEAHVAADDVPQLRQLVEAGLADEAADAGDAVVAVAGPDRRAALLGVLAHR